MMKNVMLSAAIALMVSGCGNVVDTGHVGVKKYWGAVENVVLEEGGPYWYNPFSTDIIEINVQEKVRDYNALSYTKDSQTVAVKVNFKYQLVSKNVPELVKQVGTNFESVLIDPVVFSTVKDEVAKYTAIDLLNNRAKFQSNVEAVLKAKVNPQYVVTQGLQVTNLDYDDAFEAAIQRKVVAEQDAIRAQNVTRSVEESKKQKILMAEAEAESLKIRAQAMASNPQVAELEEINRWNGVIPLNAKTVVIGDTKALYDGRSE